MGVYVKGMEKSRRCYGCMAYRHSIRGDEYDYCTALDRKYNDNKFDLNPFTDKFGDCPLIEVSEPHGRLIDENDVIDAIHERLKELQAHPEFKKKHGDIDLIGVMQYIAKIKTVIESEE